MKTKKKANKNILIILLTLSTVLMLILAFPEFNAFYLAFLGFIPLFIVLEIEKSIIKVIFCVEIFVLIFYTYLLYWIRVFHDLALPGVILYLLVIYPLPFVFYRMVKRNQPFSLTNILLLSSILTLFENFRNLGFTKFPYGNLAYSQYEFLSFIQISDIIGSLGVSFILYFFNACWATLILKILSNPNQFFSSRLKIIFNRGVLSVVVIVLVYVYGVVRMKDYQFKDNPTSSLNEEETSKKIKVGLIQPWFDYNQKWNKKSKTELYNKLINQTLEIAEEDLDLIIWPESAILDYYNFQIMSNLNQESVAREFYDFFRAYGKQYPRTQFLIGSADLEFITNDQLNQDPSNDVPQSAKDSKTSFFKGVKKYNVALLINEKGEVVAKRGKHHLVGFAEHFPYQWILDYLPFLKKALKEAHASDFSPYLEYNVMNFKKGNLATLICYDSVFPELSRLLTLKGAKFLVVITNDAWSYSTRSQVIHYSFSIFRAIENRKHLIRVGNAGVTTILLPNGKPNKTLDMFVEGALVSEFIFNDEEITFFSLYGNLIFYVFILVFFTYYFGFVGLLLLPWLIIKKTTNFFLKK